LLTSDEQTEEKKMAGNFTALALTLVMAALVSGFAVCIFAFEILTLLRERVIRDAATPGGGNRWPHTASIRQEHVRFAPARDNGNRPSSGYQPAKK
jgi:hypothetical protein